MSKKQEELKKKLILGRLDKVYCRLKPSSIDGVGVFAIRTIPTGVNPFSGSFMAQGAIVVNKNNEAINDPEILKLLHDFHPTADESKQIVSDWMNQPIWTNYINYNYESPNIQLFEDGEWRTLRQIEVGEELVEDPRSLNNPDGSQKVYQLKHGQYPNLSY